MFSKLLREPLVHFLAIGAALFALSALLGGSEDPESRRIVVTRGRIEHLATSFERVWTRPPSQEEMDGLIAGYIQEEVLYREAMALGLDRDDMIVRRRLRQKMEFLAEESPPPPTDADLRAYLDAHPDEFQVGGQVAFEHVYINRDLRGESAEGDAEQMLARLRAAPDSEVAGDPFLLEHSFPRTPTEEISRTFGEAFARGLMAVPVGEWRGPVESGYGLHLVRVRERVPGRKPELEEVRDAVVREWSTARQAELRARWYENLQRRYTVVVEPAASTDREQRVGVAR